jgi:hypothetical protein
VIDLEKNHAAVERSPLGSDELIDLLYERRESAPSTKIDLFEQKIVVGFGAKTERFSSAENAVLRLRQLGSVADSSVGVYVFSHRFYRGITDSLKTLGRPWREISIPQALREPDGGGQGWSTGFSELIAHSSDRAQFRGELARLLQSGSFDEHSNQSRHARRAIHRPVTMISHLDRWLQTALNALSILGGLIFVGWVEIVRTKRIVIGR